MKSELKIFIAFAMNLLFSIVEFVGGAITGSAAIMSDSLHSLSDAAGIGLSFFLEKRSKKGPDNKHTFGYARYSLLGSVITNTILAVGAGLVIHEALESFGADPGIDYSGMIIIAIIGAVANLIAAIVTRHGHSHNQKAVNLHLISDVLSWLTIIIGAIVMKNTGFYYIDTILSLAIAGFILFRVFMNFRENLFVFLDNTPPNVDLAKLLGEVRKLGGVKDVNHVHVWSLDGYNNCATLHLVTNTKNTSDVSLIKDEVREIFSKYDIKHATIEVDFFNAKDCEITRRK